MPRSEIFIKRDQRKWLTKKIAMREHVPFMVLTILFSNVSCK